MQKTGVRVTDEELADLRRLANSGWRPGDMMVVGSIADGIRKGEATVDAQKLCHNLALHHGLPEISGYYGITDDGEFVRT